MMMYNPSQDRIRLALLIDGDNISPHYAEEIVSKVAMQGDVVIRQVFGDFLGEESTDWISPAVRALGIESVHVDRRHQGSKATDVALIAHAKALAKTATVDGICVASSDGDFACLEDTLQQAQRLFLVAAPALASRKLVDACHQYVALDGHFQPPNPSDLSSLQLMLLNDAIALHKNKKGWAKLSAVSEYLQCHSESYAKGKWGYPTLSKLLRDLGCFDVARYYGGQMRTRRRARSRCRSSGNIAFGDTIGGNTLSSDARPQSLE